MLYANQTVDGNYAVVDTDDWTSQLISRNKFSYCVNDLGIRFNTSKPIITPTAQKLKTLGVADICCESMYGGSYV